MSTSRPHRVSTRSFVAVLVVLCAAAAVIQLWTTATWGIGVSPDSVSYLDAADNLRHGNGLTHTADDPVLSAALNEHAPAPLVLWAPLYSVILAALSLTGLGLLEAARVLNALLFAGTLALVGILVLRTTGSRVGALLAVAALALSPVGLDLHSRALSEPLYVFLSYAALALGSYYLSAQRPAYLWGAAGAAALALLTRYAAVPLLAAIATPLVLFGRGALSARLARGAAFVAVSALPLLAWLIRNWLRTGTATGRELSWHPMNVGGLKTGLNEISMLLVPPDLPSAVRGPLALAIVVAICVAGARASRRTEATDLDRYMLASIAIYVLLYSAFLLFSISALDALTTLGGRFLYPLYPGVVVVSAWILVNAFRSGFWRIALPVGLAAFLCMSAVGLVAEARSIRAEGNGYSGREWSSSPAIARVRTLPERVSIYSDHPDLIYFATHRRALSVPSKSNPLSNEPNEDLDNELHALRERSARDPVFVLFTVGYRPFLVEPRTLIEELGLVQRYRTADAGFYTPGGNALRR